MPRGGGCSCCCEQLVPGGTETAAETKRAQRLNDQPVLNSFQTKCFEFYAWIVERSRDPGTRARSAADLAGVVLCDDPLSARREHLGAVLSELRVHVLRFVVEVDAPFLCVVLSTGR